MKSSKITGCAKAVTFFTGVGRLPHSGAGLGAAASERPGRSSAHVWRVGLLLVLLAAISASTARSVGAAAPPSLDNEVLITSSFQTVFGSFASFNAACNQNGTSTLSFTASGGAGGPYPGTFTEFGSLTVGPIGTFGVIGTGDVSGLDFGYVIDLRATFTITSGSTTITGTKHHDMTVPTPDIGGCENISNGTIVPAGSDPGLTNASGSVAGAKDNDLLFSATIHTPSGSFAQSGSSQIGLGERNLCGTSSVDGSNVCLQSGHLVEFFGSSSPVTPLGPAAVTLSPPDAVNTVGTSHTVTATVSDAGGSPAAGSSVLFNVQGSVTTSGSCTTNSFGQCNFTYNGPQFPGADVITGCADANGSGTVDAGEPCGTATKAWGVADCDRRTGDRWRPDLQRVAH